MQGADGPGRCPLTGLDYIGRWAKLPQFDAKDTVFQRVVEKISNRGAAQKRVVVLRSNAQSCLLLVCELTRPPRVKRYVPASCIAQCLWQPHADGTGHRAVLLKFEVPTGDSVTGSFDLLFHQSPDPRNPDNCRSFVDTLRTVAEKRGIRISFEQLDARDDIRKRAELDKKKTAGYQAPFRTAERRAAERSRSVCSDSSTRQSSVMLDASQRGLRSPSVMSAQSDASSVVHNGWPGSSSTDFFGSVPPDGLPPPCTVPPGLLQYKDPRVMVWLVRVVERRSAKGKKQKRVLVLNQSHLILCELRSTSGAPVKRHTPLSSIPEGVRQWVPGRKPGERFLQLLLKVPSEGVDVLLIFSPDERNDPQQGPEDVLAVLVKLARVAGGELRIREAPPEEDLYREASLEKPADWAKPQKLLSSPKDRERARSRISDQASSRASSAPLGGLHSVLCGGDNPPEPAAADSHEGGAAPVAESAPMPPPSEPAPNSANPGNSEKLAALQQLLTPLQTPAAPAEAPAPVLRPTPLVDGLSPVVGLRPSPAFAEADDVVPPSDEAPTLNLPRWLAGTIRPTGISLRYWRVCNRVHDAGEDKRLVCLSAHALLLMQFQGEGGMRPLWTKRVVPVVDISGVVWRTVRRPKTVKGEAVEEQEVRQILITGPALLIVQEFDGRNLPAQSQSAFQECLRHICLCRGLPFNEREAAPGEDLRAAAGLAPQGSPAGSEGGSDYGSPPVTPARLRPEPLPEEAYEEIRAAMPTLSMADQHESLQRVFFDPRGMVLYVGVVHRVSPAGAAEERVLVLTAQHVVLADFSSRIKRYVRLEEIEQVTACAAAEGRPRRVTVATCVDGESDLVMDCISDPRNRCEGDDAFERALREVCRVRELPLDISGPEPPELTPRSGRRGMQLRVDTGAERSQGPESPRSPLIAERQESDSGSIQSDPASIHSPRANRPTWARRGSTDLLPQLELEDRCRVVTLVPLAPAGLKQIEPPAALRHFADPNLLFIRAVDKVTSSGSRRKRIVMLTTTHLLLCEDRLVASSSVIKRFVRIEHIDSVLVQDGVGRASPRSGLFDVSRKDRVLRILVKIQRDNLDILFIQTYDSRNPEPDDQDAFMRVLRALMRERGRELSERQVDESENLLSYGTLKKGEGYVDPQTQLRRHRSLHSSSFGVGTRPPSCIDEASLVRQGTPTPAARGPAPLQAEADALARSLGGEAVDAAAAAVCREQLDGVLRQPEWEQLKSTFRARHPGVHGGDLDAAIGAALSPAEHATLKRVLKQAGVQWELLAPPHGPPAAPRVELTTSQGDSDSGSCPSPSPVAIRGGGSLDEQLRRASCALSAAELHAALQARRDQGALQQLALVTDREQWAELIEAYRREYAADLRGALQGGLSVGALAEARRGLAARGVSWDDPAPAAEAPAAEAPAAAAPAAAPAPAAAAPPESPPAPAPPPDASAGRSAGAARAPAEECAPAAGTGPRRGSAEWRAEVEQLRAELRAAESRAAEQDARAARHAAEFAAVAEERDRLREELPRAARRRQQQQQQQQQPSCVAVHGAADGPPALSPGFAADLLRAGVSEPDLAEFAALRVLQAADLADVTFAELAARIPAAVVRRALRGVGWREGADASRCLVPLSPSAAAGAAGPQSPQSGLQAKRLQLVQAENASLRETIGYLKQQVQVLREKRAMAKERPRLQGAPG